MVGKLSEDGWGGTRPHSREEPCGPSRVFLSLISLHTHTHQSMHWTSLRAEIRQPVPLTGYQFVGRRSVCRVLLSARERSCCGGTPSLSPQQVLTGVSLGVPKCRQGHRLWRLVTCGTCSRPGPQGCSLWVLPVVLAVQCDLGGWQC